MRIPLKEATKNILEYLSSPGALDSIERDPYWPKWDSPWWHMSLLNEMDLAKEIPKASISKMVQVLKTHYLPVYNEEFGWCWSRNTAGIKGWIPAKKLKVIP
ncbi:MAG: hypothetical protein JNM39_13260 [Bdellovibrionaceae bacterium]|nr:hypothetical protein [Pseudobdellovibrionaceae bacterium]